MMRYGRSFTALRWILLLAVVLSAVTVGAFSPAAVAQEGSATPIASTAYPLTIQNCDIDLTLAAAPQRVVIMDPAALAILSEIGALDRVVARIGPVPSEYFSADVNDAIAQVPELISEQGSNGGATISLETVLDLQPDLIIGYETETITR